MVQARRPSPRAGERVPASIRRIGHRHVILTPGSIPQLVEIEDVDRAIIKAMKRITGMQQELQRARLELDELEQVRASFDEAPIDRQEGDPEVPQGPPVRVRVRRVARESGEVIDAETDTGEA